MSPFPDKLRFEDAGMHKGSRLFMLIEKFRYFSSYGTISVPAFFITDGASIPRVFHSLMGPYGSYFYAAVIHDYLYSAHNDQFDRYESDQIFKEAMFNVGVPWWTRETVFRAVRLAGWRHFKGTATL
jgi:hypothetical protein